MDCIAGRVFPPPANGYSPARPSSDDAPYLKKSRKFPAPTVPGTHRMVVGVCGISLLIHDAQSLKGKRQVIKSLQEKVRNRFNVSMAEVGDNDLWQRAELAVAAIGNDRAFINSVIDKVVNFIENLHVAEIIDHRIEIINC